MRRATRRAEQHVRQTLIRAGESASQDEGRRAIASKGLAAVASMIDLYRDGGLPHLLHGRVADRGAHRPPGKGRRLGRMDPARRDAHRRLWIDVVRQAQPGYVAAPASLPAFVAWQDGNGPLANVVLDRALEDRPSYPMATMLRQVVTAGVSPSMARLTMMTPEGVAAWYDQ